MFELGESGEVGAASSGPSGLPAFDPVDVEGLAEVPAERLEAELLAAAARVAAGTCAFLVMVGEFDRRGLHESWESVSTAQWLGWKVGVGIHAAREQVRVGRRLLELPVVRGAFSVGRLSYSKVRAITRVAHSGNEAALVELALHATAAQVEQACSRLRRVVDPLAEEAELADAERKERERCSVTWFRDDDGALVGSFRLAPEDGEVFRRALAAAVDEHAPVVEGEREPLEHRRALALVGMCSERLASPDTGDGPAPQIVVELDVAALAALAGGSSEGESDELAAELDDDHPIHAPASPVRADVPAGTRASRDVGNGSRDPGRGGTDAGSTCCASHVPAGTSLPVPPGWRWPVRTSSGLRLSLESLERIADEAVVTRAAKLQDGTSLDLGRSQRTPNRATRRALVRRDGHCRFPGCTAKRGLQAHHIVWWTEGGRTDMANLLMLCSKHHHAIHDRRWVCTGTADAPVFERPDGRVVPVTAPPLYGKVADLVAGFEAHGLDIAVTEPGGRWYGDRIDWDCFFAAFVPISQPLAASAA